MAEKFCTRVASVASGTDKTLINIFHAAATPTNRGRLYDVLVGSVATPADQAADFYLGRTTAVGTEGSSGNSRRTSRWVEPRDRDRLASSVH